MNNFFNRGVLATLLLLVSSTSMAKQPLQVVASFSILGDLVSEIAGDKIALTVLVKNDADSHVYQPTPADVTIISHADLVFFNGLGFEGWLPRLLESSHFSGKKVIVSNGIETLKGGCKHHAHDDHDHGHDSHHAHDDHDHGHDSHHAHDGHDHDHDSHHAHHDHDAHHHGDLDPHAWHSVTNVKTYVENIYHGLVAIDPDNKAYYQDNLRVYLQKLTLLDKEIKAQFSALSNVQRRVIVPHSAFAYFQRDYQVNFYALQGTSTSSEASATDIARLIDQVREQQINAIFMENMNDSRLIEQVSRDTGVKVAGKLYSDALSNNNASTYLELMRYNTEVLINALL